MKQQQDFLPLIRIKPPSTDDIRKRILELPGDMISQTEELQHRLYMGELDNDYAKVFRTFSKYADSFPLFVYLFGNAEYLKKLQKLPVLSDEDLEALRVAELNLTNYILKNVENPKFLEKPKEPKVYPPEKPRMTDEEYWDRKRINAGAYGYRQIAKKLRRYLERDAIEITPEDRSKMREIFRRPRGKEPYVGGRVDGTSWLKWFIIDEFEGRLKTAEDWMTKVIENPTFASNPDALKYARYRYEILMGLREPLRYSAKLRAEYERVKDLEKLFEEQPHTTAQYWEVQDILKGDWPAAAEREFCATCGEEAGFLCEACPLSAAYCGEICQSRDWYESNHKGIH